MSIEGLWTVQFGTPQGNFGGGVIVLTRGRAQGGDGMYYYDGRYTLDGTQFRAELNVVHYFGPANSIFGNIRNLSLVLQGSTSERLIVGTGYDPRMTARTLNLQLRRVSEPVSGDQS